MTIITIPVRKAVPADRPELMDICREGFAEHGMFKMDEVRVGTMIDRAFNRGGAIIGVLGETGNIQASIYLLISQFWYTNEFCLEELWNHVRPAYRRSANAKDMISFAKRCAQELQVPLVIGVVANERTEAKIGLYKRQLGSPVGGYFAFNMPNRETDQRQTA
jgi:hypothetical protein